MELSGLVRQAVDDCRQDGEDRHQEWRLLIVVKFLSTRIGQFVLAGIVAQSLGSTRGSLR